jgi:hypothetical protein
MDINLDLWTVLVAAIGTVAGAAGRAYGERLRSLERYAQREVSERDLWVHIRTLEVRIEHLTTELQRALERSAALEATVAMLRERECHPAPETAPEQAAPEAPHEGASPVPGGDA